MTPNGAALTVALRRCAPYNREAMPMPTVLLLAVLAFVLVVVGRLVWPRALRPLTGGLLFFGVAALAKWAAGLAAAGSAWERYAHGAFLLAIGYLAVRLFVLLVFDALVVRRVGVPVPRLARDVIALLLYLLVAAVILKLAFDTNVGTLVGGAALATVVLGFALQETLGTLLSGLALTWERRLEAGTWVEIGSVVGEIEELGWRSLVLRTTLGVRVVLPNSLAARERVSVLGDGSAKVAVPVRLGVAYGAKPHQVKVVLAAVALDTPRVLREPAAQILTHEFADNAVTYECRLWTQQGWKAADITDDFLTRAHAALQRAGMEIPFPQRTVHLAPGPVSVDGKACCHEALARCTLFAGLPEGALALLAETARMQHYAPGEAVVREGEASRALFVVADGEVAIERGAGELARVRAGEVFGEMAFLSGAPRAATVRALGALAVVEVDSAALARLLAEHGELAQELASRMAARERELRARAELGDEGQAHRSLAGFLLERLLHLVRH